MKKTKVFCAQTQVTRAGRAPEQHFGFVNTPIYRGSTVLFKTMDDFLNGRNRYEYGRLGSPGSDALHEAWAELTQAAGAVSVPSGVAAISLALLSCVKPGDHILVTDSVYHPTRRFCDHVLKQFAVETEYYDPLLGGEVKKLFRKNTTVVYTESPGSMTFEVQDIPAIAEAAHEHGAVMIMDNTWATPLFFAAHRHGVDISLEAGTKYLIGHSDALIGMVSANEKYWPQLKDTHRLFGMCSSPEDQFLALRGLRTLSLRLKHQEKSTLNVAKWLSARPEVARVLHPALPSCPGHEIWKRDFTGSTSVFGLELKEVSKEKLAMMVDNLELFGIGASWGGYESLVIPFNCGYRTCAPSHHICLRIQIGLEDEQDLIADLEAGFARLKA